MIAKILKKMWIEKVKPRKKENIPDFTKPKLSRKKNAGHGVISNVFDHEI